ncbi:MAG: sulfotransferase family protein [Alphaproteobacteria bacterium]|nr:sulfotransferase family protein [Alphaproteobacteria bacterium]MBV9694808.1 sulfotransferase family protein [Alphaproteobacteria bacterium]
MSLKVIGAGFGRTGTHSLKIALEMLGFAPCYHMVEVFSHPGQSEMWEAAARGDVIDWQALLGPYKAAVDWPASYFWRPLMAMYPDAKVILTERDPEAWYKSMSQTILEFMKVDADTIVDPVARAQRKMGKLIVSEKTFGGRFDKEHVLDVYRANSEAVKREVPKDRLLVFDSPDGWKPLCEFLGVPVPDAPYPLTNTTEEFRARAARR